jgi:hypothetical protein
MYESRNILHTCSGNVERIDTRLIRGQPSDDDLSVGNDVMIKMTSIISMTLCNHFYMQTARPMQSTPNNHPSSPPPSNPILSQSHLTSRLPARQKLHHNLHNTYNHQSTRKSRTQSRSPPLLLPRPTPPLARAGQVHIT